jgi:hypothetical protein
MFAGNCTPENFARRCSRVDGVSWRLALIDSCGNWPGAVDAAAFVSDGRRVERRATVADPSGHGSRIARLFAAGEGAYELLLGQVFLDLGPTSGAAVAAAVDWAVAEHIDLIHMSLGLDADRPVLASAVQRAIGLGCIIVASTPARGAPAYPAAYPQVIRATGDARCRPGEVSCLGTGLFGGCPRFAASGPGDREAGAGVSTGASVGAAWVTRHILSGPKQVTVGAVIAALTASARYVGRERRGSSPISSP